MPIAGAPWTRGGLVQQSESPLLHMPILREMHQAMRAVAFTAPRTLFFPQPIYPSGWWSATMAGKVADLSQFRAEDVARKAFETQYYNAEIHHGALAQPAFFRCALAAGD